MPATPIISIRDLVHELSLQQRSDAYARILSRYAVPVEQLQRYFRWNKKHYTRTCIHRDREFELLVICYEPGQATSIHDYDSQDAWIHFVQGEIEEERFSLVDGVLRTHGTTRSRPGSPDLYRSGRSIHRFINHGPERAVTLNLYAKPLSRWHVYEAGSAVIHTTPPGSDR